MKNLLVEMGAISLFVLPNLFFFNFPSGGKASLFNFINYKLKSRGVVRGAFSGIFFNTRSPLVLGVSSPEIP